MRFSSLTMRSLCVRSYLVGGTRRGGAPPNTAFALAAAHRRFHVLMHTGPPPKSRQAERRDDIKEVLQHWGYAHTLDLSPRETEGRYFEGTGVLVIDRINGVAYVALSERADRAVAEARLLGTRGGGGVRGRQLHGWTSGACSQGPARRHSTALAAAGRLLLRPPGFPPPPAPSLLPFLVLSPPPICLPAQLVLF
jgi:hypothetical protein